MTKLAASTFLVLVFLLVPTSESHAMTFAVSDFTKITNAQFLNLPGSNLLSPLNFDGVTISPSVNVVSGLILSAAPGNAANPADGDGYIVSTRRGAVLLPSVTLDFTEPLAAFGVTFHHFTLGGWGNDLPSVLRVFDGTHGSGALLAQVISFGPPEAPDFVGAWSDVRNIRSAVLSGTGSAPGFAVDGYGVSLTPTPEPATLLLVGTTAASLGLARWRQRRRKQQQP